MTSKWRKGTGGPSGDECQNLVVVAHTIQASAGHHGHSSPRGDGSDNLVIAFDAAQITHPENRLTCEPGGPNGSLAATGQACVAVEKRVRRLTPKECERLQGLPDDWTNVEGASDSKRYKAIGNGGVVSCMEWIAKNLARELSGETT